MAFALRYKTKAPITATDLLNDPVLPFFKEYDLPMLQISTERGTEFHGAVEVYDYKLYTWPLMTQSIVKPELSHLNGICESFHKTKLQESYQITFRKKLYTNLEMLQSDLDGWLYYYNNERTHQGKMCFGRTPIATMEDSTIIWQGKMIA